MGSLRLAVQAAVVFASLAVLTAQCGGGSVVTLGSPDGSSGSHACVPGASVACAGPGGCAGFQVCVQDGSGLGPCECGGSQGSSSGSDATVGASGSTSSGSGSGGTSSSGAGGSSGGPVCVAGARICNGSDVDICISTGQWQFLSSCTGGCSAGACTSSSSSGGGTMCLNICQTNLDCQQTCPAAVTGSVNCCDFVSGTCFVAQLPACPAPFDGAAE